MKCPQCSNMENKVIDSRTNRDGDMTRRRRECLNCGERFTTYERIEQTPILVVKKDGRREEFNRDKILSGVQKACQKRPVSVEQMENLVDNIERYFQESGEKEVSAVTVGEKVVQELYHLDSVAYVRFASVYRDFKDVNQFMSELKDLIKTKED
ncbi:MAG: transcriptional repressor NrdR [Nitrospinaceae bacterium]|nr:transcriptional repressor NrdR [Nitrospinaceae bacterium]NIR55006.1 transcriptional repressor NrdR [Nitrospinaceae bacterium]NIT82246.1 transcriptional repressor NrdR [Nitrospinaceae bacterium]NIX34631.1 transcriptional repressor NrdR [Nitrospinaceae bacterium]NIY15463.1 transcriptional repressor NrdR [Nitrospinaceae bacterium]